MKKLLNIIGDSFLFLFLITILLVPVVVSFNLDPKVHEGAKPAVAGVAVEKNTNQKSGVFEVQEQLTTSTNVFVKDIEAGQEYYTIKIGVEPETALDESIRIGKILNKQHERIMLIARFESKNLTSNTNLRLIAKDEKFTLNKESQLAFFDIDADESKDVFLTVRDKQGLSLEGNITLSIHTE